ncbi:MAG TPA: zinc-dependent metalloprotease family protein [Flavobacterium sp.]
MKKPLLLFVLLCLSAFSATAQTDRAWTASPKDVKPAQSTQRLSFPTQFSLVGSDLAVMRQALISAPRRFQSTKGIIVSLPNANGGIERFELFEASNFEPELQAQFPDIRAYAGKGIDDKMATVRMSIDPKGIQAMIFRVGSKNEFIEPYSEDGTTYAVYRSSRNKGSLPFTCSTEDFAMERSVSNDFTSRSDSGQLLTFRLAMSCNGEYTAYHGGTVAGALAAINATITRVNGVFEQDLAIHLSIIANTTAVIYTNASTDPYTTMAQWNNQLQSTLTANIGEANYDVGHMFGATGGGGNAGCIGCVCNTGKGRGITSPADGIPMGDNFDIDYVAHELGHQFGANHTFSNNVEGTDVNVEPGSGSTIMGYAGITAQDIQAHSDDYFVYASIKQIQDNMATKTCPVATTIPGDAPVINAGANYTIPKSTPFVLNGSGTDADGDTLTYCWEQNDSATSQTGANSQASPTKAGGPNWRSYDPVATPQRYFPPLARVINNQLTSTFNGITTEAVSSVARNLNFVLTGRDHVLGVGQTHTDGMTVTVNGTAGPFLVTAPNTAISYEAGSNQTVTWDVAGTTANGVNAAFVDIMLSTDGGFTYPILLASEVPNDGSEVITTPNVIGTTNRIMIKGYNHIFYDISNTNFSITAPAATFAIDYSMSAGQQNKTACSGEGVAYTIPYTVLNGFSGATSFSVAGQPAGSTVTFSPTTMNATGNVTMSVDMGTAAAGFYTMTVTATSGATSKTVNLYLKYGFNLVALTSPADLAVAQNTNVTLTWTADPNAILYDVQVADDVAFTNIINAVTVSGTSYQISGLMEAHNYFWRVMPKNAQCAGTFSGARKFTTGVVACSSTSSANVPLPISAVGTPTINSTVNIPTGVNISDVNITMAVNHTWINDLTATLIAPSGTQVILYDGPCVSDSILNINATFDDSGAVVVCGTNPGISGTVKSLQLLSAFNGQNSAGTWTLKIKDNFNQDGGSLQSWSLNICTTTEALAVDENTLTNFVIYPNPNSGTFNVQFSSASGDNVKINVYDIRGREIFARTYQNNGLFNENLQLENASAGIYLVTVQNGPVRQVRKIVIQ